MGQPGRSLRSTYAVRVGPVVSHPSRLPFQPGGDARSYLLEALVVAASGTLGAVLFIAGYTWPGCALFGLACVVFQVVVARRARGIPARRWRATAWERQDREMSTLRLEYLRAACRDRHVPESVITVGLGLMCLSVGVSVALNWGDYF